MRNQLPDVNDGRHQDGLRGEKAQPGEFGRSGRFGRLFPELDPLAIDDAVLEELGAAMAETTSFGDGDDHQGAPAGYTYLGQFIDHDMTFDTTSLSEQLRDPDAILNFRTAQLELDSLYGTGPRAMPHLYERVERDRFVIGATAPVLDLPSFPNDLPRMAGTGFAIIADPRNDENLAVAQTHLAFLKFHNAVVEKEGLGFDAARQLVTWHYQWIILNDFLRKRVVDPAVLDDVLLNGRQFYHFENAPDAQPFIPVEFSVAAYRLGHSMVRQGYSYNLFFEPPNSTATLELLFRFSGRSGDGANVPVPSNWIIDWRRFYDVGSLPPGRQLGFVRKINTRLAPALQTVPGVGSLAAANLKRGVRRGLPSGQDVARAMGIAPLLADQFDGTDHPDAVIRAHGLGDATPLWYYILKEAELAGGQHLGPVGSRIVSEVFVGLLQSDKQSFLHRDPNWTPTLGGFTGQFDMADLLIYVDDLNPLGDP